jgi:hypothetical protein
MAKDYVPSNDAKFDVRFKFMNQYAARVLQFPCRRERMPASTTSTVKKGGWSGIQTMPTA